MSETRPTGRTMPEGLAGERGLLDGWLDYYRATLLTKCEGLSGEQLVARSCQPSPMSLLGLVRHLTEMERVYGHRLADWSTNGRLAAGRHGRLTCGYRIQVPWEWLLRVERYRPAEVDLQPGRAGPQAHRCPGAGTLAPAPGHRWGSRPSPNARVVLISDLECAGWPALSDSDRTKALKAPVLDAAAAQGAAPGRERGPARPLYRIGGTWVRFPGSDERQSVRGVAVGQAGGQAIWAV